MTGLLPSMLPTIVEMLPKLSPQELEQLHSRVKALKSLVDDHTDKVITQGDDRLDDSWVIDGIQDALATRGVTCSASLHRMAVLRGKVPGIANYLRATNVERTAQQAILKMGISLLYDNLMQMNVPISVGTMIRHLDRMPAVIDWAFPGYAAAGLLGWVATRGRK